MTVSLCSIAYNESVLLPSWIEAWSKLPWVNKINIVDAYSTDKTLEIARSYPNVNIIQVKWQNDFARQRNIVIKLCKDEWLLQADLDELPISNLQDPRIGKLLTSSHDLIQLPYIKFYDAHKLQFFKNGSTPSINNNTITSGYKSTLNIYRKGVLKGYSKSLHEEPFSTATNAYTFQPQTKLCDLPSTFMVAHYDNIKMLEQAKRYGTSLAIEHGLKRLRYRFINPATYDGVTYDKSWAERAWAEYQKGNPKMVEELGNAQIKAFEEQHVVLNNFDASNLHSDPVKRLL